MMPFRTNIQNNLEKLKEYQIKIIAPSHGPLHNKPEFIMKAYHSWVFDEPRQHAWFCPMFPCTAARSRWWITLSRRSWTRGVSVKQYDLPASDIGKLAMSLVDAATVVIGTPTVLAGPHPLAAYAAFLANALRPNVKFVSIIGSYGWGGKAVETLAGMIPNLKAEVIPPVLCKGLPREADLKALDGLADAIAEKHKVSGFK